MYPHNWAPQYKYISPWNQTNDYQRCCWKRVGTGTSQIRTWSFVSDFSDRFLFWAWLSKELWNIILLNVAEFILYVGNSGILSQGTLSCNLRVYQVLKSLVEYNILVPRPGSESKENRARVLWPSPCRMSKRKFWSAQGSEFTFVKLWTMWRS